MRELDTGRIREAVKDLIIRTNLYESPDMTEALKKASEDETSDTGREILSMLLKNLEIAREDRVPVCQDTGMSVLFIEVGQEVHLVGDYIGDAVDQGVREACVDGHLRASVVGDPIIRENTGDNTPAVIHYSLVPGDKVRITAAPKGFGSENMSRLAMLKPADGIDGVKKFILETVENADANACPPYVVGVGIGGDFEQCALMSKKALTRECGSNSGIPWVRELEKEMLEKINESGIGPAGLGGAVTALAVNVETGPTHIAGLPVAVNMCCHVCRHAHAEI
ncbi:MAG: fumarate hydratase [Lachnospiraceae bacterium]|nr:fumarate hydratase [Lachnospiraceae bacterium]